MKKIKGQTRLQRFWTLSQNSQDIVDHKEMLDLNFRIFQLHSDINIQTSVNRILEMLSVRKCFDERGADIDADEHLGALQEIPQADIKLVDYVNHDGNVWKGHHDGKVVLVKKYKDEALWHKELKAWRKFWEPCWLEVFGRSKRQGDNLYLVLRDPGKLVQNYVKEYFQGDPQIAIREVVNVLKQVTTAARISLQSDPACRLDMAEVHMRPDGCPVLVDFDPYDFHAQSARTEQENWDSFLSLSTKMLTGNTGQPNHVAGQSGGTGASATYMLKWLLHFLFDFRYNYSRNLEGTEIFDKLWLVLGTIETDVNANDTSDNPILGSLQHHFPGLFAFLDSWTALSAEPGDIGVLEGTSSKRPVFREFGNVAKQIPGSTPYLKWRQVAYQPHPLLWSSEVVGGGATRHTLRMGDADITDRYFRFQRPEHRKEAALNENWDVRAAWSCLFANRPYIQMLAEEHGVNIHDVVLVFGSVNDTNYTDIISAEDLTQIERADALKAAGFQDGVLYYFENISPKEKQVEGYWSTSPNPGQPLWPLSPDAPGFDWGWEHNDPPFKIEISRKGPAGHIRYLSF